MDSESTPVLQNRVPEQPVAVRIVDLPVQTEVDVAFMPGAEGLGTTLMVSGLLAGEGQLPILQVAV